MGEAGPSSKVGVSSDLRPDLVAAARRALYASFPRGHWNFIELDPGVEVQLGIAEANIINPEDPLQAEPEAFAQVIAWEDDVVDRVRDEIIPLLTITDIKDGLNRLADEFEAGPHPSDLVTTLAQASARYLRRWATEQPWQV